MNSWFKKLSTNITYTFQYPIDLKITKVFIDFCDLETEEYLGRIRIKLNEDIKSYSSMRNFLSLIQGSLGSSYKGVDFQRGGNPYGGDIDPVILPSKDENRFVDEWESDLGDIIQLNPMDDDGLYSEIMIVFGKCSLTEPKLGSIIESDLKFIKDLESKNPLLKVFDCGIIVN